ncbi:MAG TPA: hypothetical protein DEB37_04705 [Lysinibacillus sp.]|jgi:hypothetical protein|uniref:Uncharacterized protein n=1 Tax=Lysinibacillus fusiformis TaxID=28031 RepID=A0A2I0UYA0_9BACI|nr:MULTISPECIES: hypothetical protein [Lysinibacillus]HBT71580.1 hypothetical protein [Lysinibacillus sp.]KUF31259.1 hypothetical protein AK833_16080 [Lysinibacillus sp. F5]MEE3808649.1 hypothetical protein [Lysinibacillus fusiformis]PKU51045.1 hypothetical protein CRI88_15325 [Lysinibacillus fusiformis]WCH49386.1 hypothetical protein NV349_08400 [Lysinibacillus sp. OF-1]
MPNKLKPSTLSYEPFKDGTIALYTTDSLMIVPQSRYLELLHMEELYNTMHTDLDNKQTSLERERKMLKKQNAQLTEDLQKVKQQNMVLQKKVTEYNCVIEEMKVLRQQNTELLIELSKYTAMSRESLTGPLKSMIRDMREQGVGIKEIHIRIKRQINPDISYSTVRRYISELESEPKG